MHQFRCWQGCLITWILLSLVYSSLSLSLPLSLLYLHIHLSIIHPSFLPSIYLPILLSPQSQWQWSLQESTGWWRRPRGGPAWRGSWTAGAWRPVGWRWGWWRKSSCSSWSSCTPRCLPAWCWCPSEGWSRRWSGCHSQRWPPYLVAHILQLKREVLQKLRILKTQKRNIKSNAFVM